MEEERQREREVVRQEKWVKRAKRIGQYKLLSVVWNGTSAC